MRIVIAGAGAIGASIALHLALAGADDVLLCDTGEVAGGSTAKAMGGVRQQFSTAAEVRLAQASIRFFAELGPPYFEQVGYVFVATGEAGAEELDRRATLQCSLGVDVVRPERVPGVRWDDVRGAVACWSDGLADPAATTRELVRRARLLGVGLREGTDARTVDRDILVISAGPASAELAPRLPIRPLARQLLETSELDLPDRLPMVVEHETGFHFRPRGRRLVLAMADAVPRWGTEVAVDETVFGDRLERLAWRFPAAAGATIECAWAGLYDMSPDAHPVIGRIDNGIYAACGFSGHGFMQSPAVGHALAQLILTGESELDLAPYRLERFADGVEPEAVVL